MTDLESRRRRRANGPRAFDPAGHRGSALALAQAELVARPEGRRGGRAGPITTSGDARPGGAPAGARYRVGPEDKGRFVKEIEEALLAERIDLAVHSAKDVPGELPDGLAIAGVPERADARDALCGAASIDDLPRARWWARRACGGTPSCWPCARTSRSARCAATWTRGCASWTRATTTRSCWRCAGLERLGRVGEGSPISAAEMMPAAGQGCLALEARAGEVGPAEVAGALTDRTALVCLTAERALVTAIGADCHTPVGAHAQQLDGAVLRLSAFVGRPDGSHWIRDQIEGDVENPAGAGRAVAERLLAAGAAELLST